MNWLSLLGIFAKPIGAAVNTAIAAAAGATIKFAIDKGVDGALAAAIVGPIALAASTAISGLAATQGVQIPIINKDTTNGVNVVKAGTGGAIVDAPLTPAR